MREQSGARRLQAVPYRQDRPARRDAPSGVVAQARLALRPQNRLATALGGALGAGVPVATWWLAHHEVDPGAPLYGQVPAWLVLGGLLFSAPKVFHWGRQAFGSSLEALGFVLLLEGVLTASSTSGLHLAALVYSAAINAVATGARLSTGGVK